MEPEVLYSEFTEWAKGKPHINAQMKKLIAEARDRAKKAIAEFVLSELNTGRVWEFKERYRFGHSPNWFTFTFVIAAVKISDPRLRCNICGERFMSFDCFHTEGFNYDLKDDDDNVTGTVVCQPYLTTERS